VLQEVPAHTHTHTHTYTHEPQNAIAHTSGPSVLCETSRFFSTEDWRTKIAAEAAPGALRPHSHTHRLVMLLFLLRACLGGRALCVCMYVCVCVFVCVYDTQASNAAVLAQGLPLLCALMLCTVISY